LNALDWIEKNMDGIGRISHIQVHSVDPLASVCTANFKRNLPIMLGCGDYDVWQDLPWFEEPLAEKTNQIGLCFDPVVHPGALIKLYQAYPKATIVNMIKDPQMWYKHLPFDIHQRWSKWCKPSHAIPYPTENTEATYTEFYNKYHEFLRQFVATHPGWTLVEIDLTLPSETIATTLALKLGIHSQCWIGATQGNIPLYNATMPPGVQALTEQLPRSNDVTYPLLVATLEKSGTTTAHSYFKCALGSRVPVHQFTFRNGTYTDVGKCWEANDRTGRPSLENCGHKRVFSDINFFHPTLNHCYFPVVEGGFDKFAQSYPYATVLMQIRNATSWYSSVKRWNRLDQRWSRSLGCRQKGVTPKPDATQADWEEYYENYTRSVRQTVSRYPTLNYVEVPLSEDIGPVLDNVFGFSQETQCFGHENRNPV
jgi:hypothetical protein